MTNSLYSVVNEFVLSHVPLTAVPIQLATFTLNADFLATLARSTPSNELGGPRLRKVKPGSSLLRLRCVRTPSGGLQDEGQWLTSGVTWNKDISFRLNDSILEVRRKLHHGRDLPIDVTEFAHEGENKVKILTNRLSKENQKDSNLPDLSIAIERVLIMSYEDILNAITTIDRIDCLSAIQHSIVADTPRPPHTTSASLDDDDVTIMSSTVTIALFDPISGSAICRIPVRGRACRHANCFDLDTFLTSAKRDQPDGPVSPDAWRCPICRGDVRPHVMIRDGFLDLVRTTLMAHGNESARSIVVSADGRWTPKEQVATGLEASSSDVGERVSRASNSAVEVIVLDDD